MACASLRRGSAQTVLEFARSRNAAVYSEPEASARQGAMLGEIISKVEALKNLTRHEAEAAMETLLSGGTSDAQIVALLAALRAKGETVEELVGFAATM